MLNHVAQTMDEIALKRAEKKEAHASGDAENPSMGSKNKAVRVLSSSLTSFTEQAFFKRVSGDLDQIVDGDFKGRVHFGCLVNLDEGYKFLRMLGLMSDKGPSSIGHNWDKQNKDWDKQNKADIDLSSDKLP